ncbi:manganese catalase family protein [Novosphingobium fluoreni]|uniref:manganese catalase family protein n=1 Tax=Novosphingobium fluoreni TaxID=1391222 RepID=UPI003DA1735F
MLAKSRHPGTVGCAAPFSGTPAFKWNGDQAMFMHNKRLQYTVRVAEPNPALASLLLEQFGGPDGELAAAMRYFTQGLAEIDPGRKDMLLDIATEELSHLEVIGSIVAMLNKGVKGALSEAAMEEADLYMEINAGGDSHTQSLLYGGGPALTNSSGVPWTAAYIDSRGDPTCDLLSRKLIVSAPSPRARSSRWG